MAVLEVLAVERVSVANEAEGVVRTKDAALQRLAALLAHGRSDVSEAEVLAALSEREKLQSTGVGGGVAVPHGSLDKLDRQLGALLVCPHPIPFDAIDGEPVSILFALVGPKRASAEHLKILARVSRLLRSESFRQKLVQAAHGSDAYSLIAVTEAAPA
ncbi:MAG: PTS sugar transporter subunit IIA [Polyangiaceae bacterium]|nr:PTS sugar transporter subunit IIA [Polyangiaceae bacterium]